jgi:hypothetical protein
MKAIVAIAAIAAALTASISAADAHNSRHHVRNHDARLWSAPVARYQNCGPRWAQPNECYTDLGYGRFESCDR